MSAKDSRSSKKNKNSNGINLIHDQMDSNPHYPFNIQSGWLPANNSVAIATFIEEVMKATGCDDDGAYDPTVQALNELLENNDVLTFLINDACNENENIVVSQLSGAEQVNLPRIASKDALMDAFNYLLTQAPKFVDNELVGLPYSAVVVGIDPTLSGMTLFRLPMFNEKMRAILDKWNTYLGSTESNWLFNVEGEQWLSPTAKQAYQFEVWKKDNDTLPYWNSWNSFFTRVFKDPSTSRPIADPSSNKTVLSANDGSLFRWDENIESKDVFWFKDMQYSLADILSSDVAAQQTTIEQYNLVDLFTGGSIFQTYLNPYNFHRWWSPLNGKVLFDPLVVPGCYFNKLVIPDFGGATTASLPYLAQVNARGIIVFKTDDYGYVCCIPLGMSEVSTVAFDTQMKKDATVAKGQEMGMFQYGGSSFVMIFQKLPGKRLMFQNADGDVYQQRPELPKGSASTGGNVTLIGSQIGKWEDVNFTIDATQTWQTAGYVNEGMQYDISYLGGMWTANPNINNGNLYNANGSSVVATQSGYPLVGANEGALVGQVGDNAPFLIGNSAKTPAGQTGLFKLVINDDLTGEYGAGLTDNVGQVMVSITESS